ncbi:protein kinase, partial [Metarhizium majus ARSEF 297]
MGIETLLRKGARKEGASRARKDADEYGPSYDKQWAHKYLLEPLTAPEPSQETGLGSSHVNPYITAAKERLEAQTAAATSAASAASPPPSPAEKKKEKRPWLLKGLQGIPAYWPSTSATPHQPYPTPPSSASPTHRSFDVFPSSPFATSYQSRQSSESSHLSSHRNSSRQSTRTSSESISTAALTTSSAVTPPTSPSQRNSTSSAGDNNNARCKNNTHSPPQCQPRYARLSANTSSTTWGRQSYPEYPRNQLDKARRIRQNASNSTDSNKKKNNSNRKSSSEARLAERFPGDMSHRPLDMIKREARAAERPHRHRKRISETDTIDALDTIGGAYHHGGPYDATLRSRNLNKKYSPVAAVQDSNMEAIRATPRENIMDSLTKHVPLQGTASIPSGAPDMRGRIMYYEEGADLMREPDAEGGAYKRWDGIQYHPDDLKGKGEPSFTLERDLKKGRRHRHHLSEADAFEMAPGTNRFSRWAASHQRSVSQHSAEALSSGVTYKNNPDGDLRRAHSTGNKLSDGLKRRFGSIRRKKEMPSEAVS